MADSRIPKSHQPISPEMDLARLQKAVSLFEDQQRKGAFPGGQLCVRSGGKPIINFAIGIARGLRETEATPVIKVNPETPFPVLSAGKPLAAIAIALLEDLGVLDVNAPISHFVPEFKRNDKENLTPLDVLTHRSGMLMPELVRHTELWGDRRAIQRALAETKPSFPRGTLAYHPHEFGWILNEIVLCVDGRSLPQLFEEEIAIPLELPALRFGLAGRALASLAHTYWLGPEKVDVAGYNVAETFEWQNSEEFFAAMNPATSLVTDANSLAAFYDFLLADGVTPKGVQLISANVIRKYTSRVVFSWDRSLRILLAVGRGFVVGTMLPSSFDWWNTNKCFGHAGGFSSLAFGDYTKGISVAIITNGNRGQADFARRFVPLGHAIRRAFHS
jgi:CubicO group peptidase (beta-lactamase class C family)